MQIKDIFHVDDFFMAVLDSVQFGVIVTASDGCLVYVNNFARNLLDFHADIINSKVNFAELDSANWISIQKVIKTGEPQIGVPVMNYSKPLVVNRSPIVYNGEIVGAISVFHQLEHYENISEYLQKYKILTGQLEALIESSYDGIFVTDSDGVGIRANASYERITGINPSEFIGKNMCELEVAGDISESVTVKVLKSKKTETIRQLYRSGKEVLATGNPIFNDKGELIMVLTNLRDMTDLNKMSSELEQSKEMTSEYKRRLQELQRASLSDNFVAVSGAMRDLYQKVIRISGTDAPVFMHGETGVGKELVAEEIHQLSDRSKTGVLVKINCASIPETLIESELFGYTDGAFTGAKRSGKPGLLEVADNGTLFLDEINSMPLVLQAKLLRFLQNFEIRRLGSTTSKVVNVRLICASNQDMNKLIFNREFRSDLFYRLNVVPLLIPPLRERREAIPYLIQLFLKRFNQKHSSKKTLSKSCREALERYSWPGNIRELANMIERIVILSPGECVTDEDLPSEIVNYNSMMNSETDLCGLSLREQLQLIEAKIISEAVEKYGNARRAAMHLKVNPSIICRRQKKINGGKAILQKSNIVAK
ncbi:MAG: Arginine utilization regulatory protein RocR [Smithella sp. PtaU1.Bin162]|nr:MAG: Arginine utilization regulatory protein RocR [Smithella sp. PtaU1.Bin162]